MRIPENAKVIHTPGPTFIRVVAFLDNVPCGFVDVLCGTRTKLKQTWCVSYKGKVEPSPKR